MDADFAARSGIRRSYFVDGSSIDIKKYAIYAPEVEVTEECVAHHTPGGIAGCPLPLGWPGGWASFEWEMLCWCLEVLTVWAAFLLQYAFRAGALMLFWPRLMARMKTLTAPPGSGR